MIGAAWALLKSRAAMQALAGAAIVLALGLGYWTHRAALLQAGEERAVERLREEENTRLRESLRELARLTGRLGEIDRDYRNAIAEAGWLRERLRDADDRLQSELAAFAANVDRAAAAELRRYATASDGNLSRCRADVARFGDEAIRSSAAAHALKAELEEVRASCSREQ